MSIEIKGINNLINRINKLSNIEANKAVEVVAKDIEKAIKNKASEFSSHSDAIKAFEIRKYGNSSYCDIGLKASECNWEDAKGLWFQQWGFYNSGLNFKNTHPYVDVHKQWFNEAVESIESDAKKKLKEELKKQVKECWQD